MVEKKLKEQLKQYLKKLQKVLPIDRAYLVGSWAKGKVGKDSDVDLLLLSRNFNGMDIDKRLQILYRTTVGFDFDLHIHSVTEEEFQSASRLTTLGAMRLDKKILLTV